MEQHYTTRQAAKLVGETPRGIAEKCANGVIRARRPHLPHGRRGQWRIPESALRTYLGEDVPVSKPRYDGIDPAIVNLLERKDYEGIRARIQESARQLYPEKFRRASRKRGSKTKRPV